MEHTLVTLLVMSVIGGGIYWYITRSEDDSDQGQDDGGQFPRPPGTVIPTKEQLMRKTKAQLVELALSLDLPEGVRNFTKSQIADVILEFYAENS